MHTLNVQVGVLDTTWLIPAAARESFAQYSEPKALHTPSMKSMYRPIRINPFCLKMKSIDYVEKNLFQGYQIFCEMLYNIITLNHSTKFLY